MTDATARTALLAALLAGLACVLAPTAGAAVGPVAGTAATPAAGATAPATAATNPALADGNATVSLSSATAETNETVTLTLATDAAGVAGYQTELVFDPSVVRVVGVEGGDLGTPVKNVDNEAGRVVLTQSQADGVDEPTLAVVELRVVGDPGTGTTVGLVDGETTLNDADGAAIGYAIENGSVEVPAVTTVPTDSSGADEVGGRLWLSRPLLYGVGGALLLVVGLVLGRRV